MPDNKEKLNRLRLDKWLWAARFYKTRAIARRAIEGGKVSCNGTRCKPSKEIIAGNEISLRQGYEEKTIIIKALREQRRSASEAQQLYEETPQSIARRQLLSQQRRMQPRPLQPDTKPTKRQRRQIKQFRDYTD
ncbi:MAG: RNA-binding S4 domain-containing protein [Pseudohongiellaceae bacterium]